MHLCNKFPFVVYILSDLLFIYIPSRPHTPPPTHLKAYYLCQYFHPNNTSENCTLPLNAAKLQNPIFIPKHRRPLQFLPPIALLKLYAKYIDWRGTTCTYMCTLIPILLKGAYIKYARRPGGRGHPNACRLVHGGGGVAVLRVHALEDQI